MALGDRPMWQKYPKAVSVVHSSVTEALPSRSPTPQRQRFQAHDERLTVERACGRLEEVKSARGRRWRRLAERASCAWLVR